MQKKLEEMTPQELRQLANEREKLLGELKPIMPKKLFKQVFDQTYKLVREGVAIDITNHLPDCIKQKVESLSIKLFWVSEASLEFEGIHVSSDNRVTIEEDYFSFRFKKGTKTKDKKEIKLLFFSLLAAYETDYRYSELTWVLPWNIIYKNNIIKTYNKNIEDFITEINIYNETYRCFNWDTNIHSNIYDLRGKELFARCFQEYILYAEDR